MFSHFLSEGILINRVSNAVTAGTTAINGAAVDMQATPGAIGCLFIALLGTLTSTQVTSMKIQWSDTNNGSDWADFTTPVATAAAADADGNKLLVIDVLRPTHRYLRSVISRVTANAVVDGVLAMPYATRALPTTLSATYISQSAKSLDAA